MILKILDAPKTRQLIAQELGLDWKTVDRHMESLLRNNLIREICSLGRVGYYARTENANKLLALVENDQFQE